LIDEELLTDYSKLEKLRDEVMKVIEMARKDKHINHPYEAKVFLWGNGEYMDIVKKYQDYMKFYLTVSQVELSEGGFYITNSEEGVFVGVQKAEGKKCPRCWMYYREEEFVGELCNRCATAVVKMGMQV